MTKKERLRLILTLIEEQEISTQEELTALLIDKGLDVSQATVSRDINELHLIKIEGKNKKTKYFKPNILSKETSQKNLNLLKTVTTSIESANNLIVIKTLTGNAGTAGMVVDQMNFSGVLGTIAGDDTLLIIAKTNSDAEIILKTLSSI